MLIKISAAVNLIVGSLWLIGQSWLWMVLGGPSGFSNSPRSFVLSLLFLSLFLAGPLCLIIGSTTVLIKPRSLLSLVLSVIGFLILVGALGPIVYEGFYPAPLVSVDLKFTYLIATAIALCSTATVYMVVNFIQARRKISGAPDAA